MIRALLVLLILTPACTLGGNDDPPVDEDGGQPDGGRIDPDPCATDGLAETGVGRLAGLDRNGVADGTRLCATFDDPVNVEIAPSGDLIIADFNNNRLRQVTGNGDVSTFVTGSGFARPFGIAIMADGSMIVETDRNVAGLDGPNNAAIWRVTKEGGAVLVSNDTGRLRGMVPLADGRLFVTDYLNHYVGIFDPASGALAPVAGSRGVLGNAVGTGNVARFNQPYDVIPIAGGDMVLADYENHCLRRVTVPAGVVTTFAGVCGSPGYVDGPAGASQFNHPQALAIDTLGRIFVTDTDNNRIRMIVNGVVSTIAGSGVAGFADGPPLEAQFYGLEGIDVTGDGATLYIADGDRGRNQPFHRIRRLPLSFLP